MIRAEESEEKTVPDKTNTHTQCAHSLGSQLGEEEELAERPGGRRGKRFNKSIMKYMRGCDSDDDDRPKRAADVRNWNTLFLLKRIESPLEEEEDEEVGLKKKTRWKSRAE